MMTAIMIILIRFRTLKGSLFHTILPLNINNIQFQVCFQFLLTNFTVKFNKIIKFITYMLWWLEILDNKKKWNCQSGLIYSFLQKLWENNQNWFSWKGLREF